MNGTGFKQIDGGEGFDTLLLSGNIDLTGLQSIDNIEHIDMTNGTGTDSVTLNLADLIDMVDDNSLDWILPNGENKLIITGDEGDNVTLDGVSLTNLAFVPFGGTLESDPFGDGEGYYLFVDAGSKLELYIHQDLVTFT